MNFRKISIFKKTTADTASVPETSTRACRLVFFGILFLGLLVRCMAFGNIPDGINQDEAMAAMDAQALLSYHTDRLGMHFPVHFTAWGWAQMSVLLSYCMVPFIRLFGFTTAAIRLPALLFSLAGMLCMYALAKKVTTERTALLVFFLTAINPWHIMQSRWSLDCNLFPHLFAAGCLLLLMGLKKRRYIYLSMVFFGLCLYSYGVSVYSVPLFLAVAAWYLWRTKKLPLGQIFLSAAIFFLVALPELLTMFINLVGIPSIETPVYTIPYFADTVRSRDILITNFSFRQLFINLWFTLKATLIQTPDLFHNSIPAFGTLYHLSIPFILIGIVQMIFYMKRNFSSEENETRRFGMLLLAAWVLMGLWVGIVTCEVNVNRINIIYYPMIFLTALGIKAVIAKLPVLKWPVVVCYGCLFLAFSATYFTVFARESHSYYHADLLEEIRFADSLPVDHLYISTDEDAQTMEILLEYALDIDAKYLQQATNVSNGQNRLPYSDRYRFCYLGGDSIDWEQPATAYLVTAQEWEHLDDSLYTVYDYGRYRLYVHP